MRKYGWPIVLFMGLPFTARIVTIAYYAAFDFGLFSYNWLFLPIVLTSLTTAILLGVLYPWVRSNERATLRLVWSCTLMLAILTAPVYLSAMLSGYVSLTSMVIVSVSVGLVVKLWFARQASRLSLAHAFFLVGVVEGLTLHDYYDSLPLYFGWLLGLATSVLAVWLLANFDLRGHTFRRRSAIVVVALTGVGSLPLALTGVGFLPLALAGSRGLALAAFILLETALLFPLLLLLLLVYLVRVRQPTAEVSPAPLRNQR